MKRVCAAKNCLNSRRANPQLSFFRFPKGKNRCRDWLIACGRQDVLNDPLVDLDSFSRSNFLCSLHFDDSQFSNGGRKYLRWLAVPSIFNDTVESFGCITESSIGNSTNGTSPSPVTLRNESFKTMCLEDRHGLTNQIFKAKMRVLELYSGIGGMHWALKSAGLDAEVVSAVDINTLANGVYKWNFPETKMLQRNILSLSPKEIDCMKVDLITMSPPCQPFTRQGLQKDTADARSCSFLYLIEVIPQLKLKPKYIFLENVKGFETSDSRNALVNMLESTGYTYRELLLNSLRFGIPNSRLRYYLMARLQPSHFQDVDHELDTLSSDTPLVCPQLSEYLEEGPLMYFDKYFVPARILQRYHLIFDIVNRESRQSCCFTKGYGHYVEGTGSVLHHCLNVDLNAVYGNLENLSNNDERLESLQSLGLRYFTPTEVANLLGFPLKFGFQDATSTKQRYRLLGNSINVKVVAELLKLLTRSEEEG